jgi:hypothetical protein
MSGMVVDVPQRNAKDNFAGPRLHQYVRAYHRFALGAGTRTEMGLQENGGAS